MERYRRRINAECAKRTASFASWVETQPPPAGYVCPNYDLCGFRVGVKDGAMVVTTRGIARPEEILSNDQPPFPEPKRATGLFIGDRWWARLSDGWLAAFNAGEFGASIWWFSPDGSARTQLGIDNVNAVFDVGGESWLAVSDRVKGRGAVLRADHAGSGWTLVQVAALQQGAYAAVADGPQAALVVMGPKLVRVTRSGQVTTLHDGAWDMTHPFSIVTASAGRIFLGAEHAVVRLDPSGGRYVETWLVSSGCATCSMETCRCSPW